MKSLHLLRKCEVLSLINIGKSKLHQMIRDNAFPQPIKLPSVNGQLGRTSYWSRDEIEAWVELRASARDKLVKEAVRDGVNDPFKRNVH